MHMDATDRALAEHREATMPEILARNAEYEALPELTREKAWRVHLRTQMLKVWHIARTLPSGTERDALVALSEAAFVLPIEATLQEAA